MQQKQGLLIFWIIKRMKNGDASEVDGHGERAGAEVTRGRVKLAPGDCEGVKTQEFLCWNSVLFGGTEPELFLCCCTMNKWFYGMTTSEIDMGNLGFNWLGNLLWL